MHERYDWIHSKESPRSKVLTSEKTIRSIMTIAAKVNGQGAPISPALSSYEQNYYDTDYAENGNSD